MDFRLLGPLEVFEDNRPLPLGGAKQRSVLAILLMHANELVTTDQLIDEIWGGAPPAKAAKNIQVQVSRLRKVLDSGRLTTGPGGYVLHIGPDESDVARFERLVAEAGSAAPQGAAERLREALALWRGPALADLAYEGFAQPEIARLEEMRLSVLVQRIDADLALGRHAELVGELEALVSRHPLQERLRYQLMLALYRSARQAEALEAYRVARRELSEELGLEPSEQLRQLEQAILRQDPSLDLGSSGGEHEPLRRATTPDLAVLVAPSAMDALGELIAMARSLAIADPVHELIVAAVVEAGELQDATAALARHREELLEQGISARTAAFSSPSRGEDITRLAEQEGVDLLVSDCQGAELDPETVVVLERAPCDVALLVERGGSMREGPVIVPFGAGGHDWAALALGAWVARATGAPLRLIGMASGGEDGRDASRLLADASLIVQRIAGIGAEPMLGEPGRRGIVELAEGAGLLVVGLSDRWRHEGLGQLRGELAEEPPAPTVFVRRGARPGGLAPAETRTRFRWSLTGAMRS
ncbi:MAG TPA: BTAD domain-containing putative transcriptional regulator [Thermoleophilaceae bacterium]|nr:BTAD domain-containing putative transcriptional regulator [Thermoleophilaceae bacterium]